MVTVLTLIPMVVKAQVPQQAPDVAQVIGLFYQACVNFPGNPYGVRSWAVMRDLQMFPPDRATLFLTGSNGEVYGANNSTGKHVLVSKDDGACEVLAMSDDFEAVKQALLAALQDRGATVSPAYHRVLPDGSAEQQMYRAMVGQNHLLLSVTKHPHSDAPSLGPEIDLVMTIDNGKPAADQ